MTFPGLLLYPPFYPGQPISMPPTPRPPKRTPDLPPWRYFATRLNGDGTEERIADELPITGLQFTRAISAPGDLTGTISPEMRRLTAEDGKPVFQPRSTAIYAEADGHIRYGAMLTNMSPTGHQLALTCTGFTAMPNGEPYNGIRSRTQVDPMDEYRYLWDYYQSQAGKDYGLVIDDTTSNVLIGSPEKPFLTRLRQQAADAKNLYLSFKAEYEADKTDAKKQKMDDAKADWDAAERRVVEGLNEGAAEPYKINYWSTQDVGAQLNELATVGKFDYRTEIAWAGEDISKFVRLRNPMIGRRLEDDRYVVGENIFQTPTIDYRGEDYASEVVVLGAGDGRKMRRGSAQRRTGRMGRTVVIVDNTLTTNAQCERRAVQELRRRMGEAHIDQFTVLTHELTADEGDEILFQNTGGWAGTEEIWVRVMAITTTPESPESLLKVARVEAV